MRNLAYFLIIALFASGCSVSSRCVSPEVELPNEVVAGMEADSMCIADLKWYDIFADPCLVELIEMTIENNKDLLAAWSKVEELERSSISISPNFPSIISITQIFGLRTIRATFCIKIKTTYS